VRRGGLGAPLPHLDRRGRAATSYFPASIARDTPIGDHLELNSQPVQHYLREQCGLVQGRLRDAITVRMSTLEEVRLLRLLPGTPVLDMLRRYIATSQRPMEVIHLVLAGDKHNLVYEKGVPTRRPA